MNPSAPIRRNSGSTADSFIRPQFLTTGTTPTSFDSYRLNFGTATAAPLALPAGFDGLNSASLHWNKPHAQFLIERLSALSPAIDGVDNDGDGRTDDEDPDEQVVPGRLNLNNAELDLVRDALPFGNDTARTAIRDAIEGARDDATTSTALARRHIYGLGTCCLRAPRQISSTPPRTCPTPPPTVPLPATPKASPRRTAVLTSPRTDRGPANNARDETDDDVEEAFLFAGGTQQVTTTRSDVYVAYILVQGYRDADGNGELQQHRRRRPHRAVPQHRHLRPFQVGRQRRHRRVPRALRVPSVNLPPPQVEKPQPGCPKRLPRFSLPPPQQRLRESFSERRSQKSRVNRNGPPPTPPKPPSTS